MNPTGKCQPGGQDFSMKISADFIHFYPLKKPHLCSVWRGPPSRWPSFEHSSSKMGSLHIDLCTEHCVPVSQLHVPHQNSTSTCFSAVYEVPSCSTQLLTARTVFDSQVCILCVFAVCLVLLLFDTASIVNIFLSEDTKTLLLPSLSL